MYEFLERLKQRKLVQWAVAYVAAAFALLQGIDIVAQQFEWPEAIRRGSTLAMVVGFFVALLLAWYHGERGAQRVNGTELLILAVILAVGGGLLWRFAPTRRAPAATESVVAADARTAADARVAIGHVRGALLVPDEDVVERGVIGERVVDRQRGAARVAEDDLDPRTNERLAERVRAAHGRERRYRRRLDRRRHSWCSPFSN